MIFNNHMKDATPVTTDHVEKHMIHFWNIGKNTKHVKITLLISLQTPSIGF